LAETVVGLYKTELIRRRGPWRSLEQVELATAEWVDWWNQRRLHSADGDLPPAEFEELYLVLGDCSYTLRKSRAGGGDLAQHGRDRIDQCCDLFADGVPATGWGGGMDCR
jgi:Integrase core domain